jgi:hypothetical protein
MLGEMNWRSEIILNKVGVRVIFVPRVDMLAVVALVRLMMVMDMVVGLLRFDPEPEPLLFGLCVYHATDE